MPNWKKIVSFDTLTLMNILLFSLISSLAAIAYGLFLMRQVLKKPAGDEKMRSIARAIEEGARAYLKREFSVVLVVGIIVGLVLWKYLGGLMALGFAAGAVASTLAGYIGMFVAMKSNVRVAEAAKKGIKSAFDLSFKGGSVTGFLVAGLALFSLTVFYWFTQDIKSLIGLGLGASLISVFARVGGGIFTKAADVGADLVGKVEAGIPEDDPRNPAVIADNLGDNVGDTKGMAADVFETYAISAIAVMLLGSLLFSGAEQIILFPLLIGGVALLASIVGSWFVRLTGTSILGAMYKGLAATIILSVAIFYWLIVRSPVTTFVTIPSLNIFYSLLVGMAVTALIFWITDYYTSKKFSPVKDIAKASTTGHGTNIITGLAVAMESTGWPIVVIVGGILSAFYFGGIYGIALATMSMLSLTAIVVSIDAFGPITDNAGGIAEMAGLPAEVRAATDPLDAVGNTTKAVTKGYAIASAGLAALILFSSYTQELAELGHHVLFDLSNVKVLVGLFLGGMMPYLFGARTMKSVGRAAGAVVDEVRRQFREIPGIMDGTGRPDYGAAVDIVTKAAIKEMIIPALIPIVFPIAVGFILGPQALGGLLVGVIVTGIFMAISMTSGGAAWDNAKKYIEEGNYGGKGSEAHKAAVTGDTVGDPYKDTAGPAINPMIKVTNIVALLIARFLI
ncbi:MAG: sodium-translocating pyrophosphatase [bacterium]|nr:sodium-translocating pyrophosphatase [bacterium]